MLAAKITIANDLKTNLTTKIANMHNVQIDYCFYQSRQKGNAPPRHDQQREGTALQELIFVKSAKLIYKLKFKEK